MDVALTAWWQLCYNQRLFHVVIFGLIKTYAGPVSCKISDLPRCNQDLYPSVIVMQCNIPEKQRPQLVSCQYLMSTGCM